MFLLRNNRLQVVASGIHKHNNTIDNRRVREMFISSIKLNLHKTNSTCQLFAVTWEIN